MNTDAIANPQTLAQRMAQGKIRVPEALRYAMILAEALRKLHDAGRAHGAVSPACISITRTGLELLPALGSVGEITPYTAPEVVDGRGPDARSDIFSFGAVLYEMLTGRPAFGGEGPALAAALLQSPPPPSGSPAVDRLVAGCVAKEPAARWQRMQKLLLELKLLAVAVQRAEAPVRREVNDPTPMLRAELQQLDSNLRARLAESEALLRAIEQRVATVESSLRETAAGLSRVERVCLERLDRVEAATAALGPQIFAQLQQSQGTLGDRIHQAEAMVLAIQQDGAGLRESVSEDLSLLEKSLKAQSAVIESTRTAVAQTDDLVERVVEALESLQSVILDQAGERMAAAS